MADLHCNGAGHWRVMCLSLFSRSVQKQPTKSESRPKVMRPLGATNDAFANADWLTRTSLPPTFTLTGVPAAGPKRDAVPITTFPTTLLITGPCVVSAALRPSVMSQKVNVPACRLRVPPFSTLSLP